jgi:hypothetical protein
MASANELFPDPLFPMITVRSAKGSSIHVTDYLVIEAHRQRGATSALRHLRLGAQGGS